MNETLLSTQWGSRALIMIELLLIASIVGLGALTTLLRDGDPKQPDFKKRAYSLAKSQQAFWTIVVIGCFIYVYFAQGLCEGVLNNTALLLLGISTATTAVSTLVGKQRATQEQQAAPADDHVPPSPHENFVDDILTDNEGVNIHRLQMAIWTIVFGGIFIHQVVKLGKFPTFDGQAYILMGISSATYVWFKKTEK